MLRQSAVRVECEIPSYAGPFVVDVDHVTSFVAIAQMAVTDHGGNMRSVMEELIDRVIGCGVVIRRKGVLIRITLIQKHSNYSMRLMLMEVKTLP